MTLDAGVFETARGNPPLEKAAHGNADGDQSLETSTDETDEVHHEYPSTWKLILITIALCLAVLCFGLVS